MNFGFVMTSELTEMVFQIVCRKFRSMRMRKLLPFFINIIVLIATIVKRISAFYDKNGDNSIMIVYNPFWKTLKEKGISTYTLIHKYNISSSTIDRMRHNRGISTLKINDLCRILNCRVEDILEYVESENEQKL